MEEVNDMKIDLHFSDRDIQSASIPVQWCLSKKLVDYFNENNITKMAIVIRPVKCTNYARQESRKVVNINDMMTYIDFKYPGDNYVIAIPINSNSKSYIETITGRNRNGWNDRLFNRYESEYLNIDNDIYFNTDSYYLAVKPVCDKIIFTHEIVQVPEGCFAPEPSQLEKDWVNFFFKYPAWDQCDFRKRRLLAYSVQPFIFAVVIALRTIAITIAHLLLIKDMSHKPIYQPLTHTIGDANDDEYYTCHLFGRITSDRPYGKYITSSYIFLNPLTLLAVFAIQVSCKPALSIAFLAIFITSLIGTLLLFIVKDSFKFINNKRIARINKNRTRELSNIAKIINEKSVVKKSSLMIDDFAVCTGSGFIPMKDLPKSKKTIKLRFIDLKSKVCKPFAG